MNKIFGEPNPRYDGIYRAKVLDNDDTSKLGRCQLDVCGVFTGVIASEEVNLPWAKPAFALATGAGLDGSTSYGNFCVPDIGTFVFVFFEDGDMYQPVYFAEAPTAAYGLPSEKDTNYPNRRVLKTKSGITIVLDDTDESVIVTVPNDYTVTIGGNCTINVTGDCTVTAVGAITLQGDNVFINP